MILAFWLLGCGGTPTVPEPGVQVVVDCLDLHVSDYGLLYGSSPLWSLDAATQTRVERCGFIGSGNLDGSPAIALAGDALLGELESPTDQRWLSFQVASRGATWITQEGTVTFDPGFARDKASGRYEGRAAAVDLVTGEFTGEEADLSGAFSWCSSARDDCTNAAGVTLPLTFTIETPAISGTGGARQCRMVHDTATGALQVELEMGVWDGRNVGTLYYNECGVYGATRPLTNYLEFTATGFTGPGTYGPVARRRFLTPDTTTELPGLEWTHPATFLVQPDDAFACAFAYERSSRLSATDASVCSWSVPDTLDAITVDCTAMTHADLWGAGHSGDASSGDVHLEADCTYVAR